MENILNLNIKKELTITQFLYLLFCKHSDYCDAVSFLLKDGKVLDLTLVENYSDLDDITEYLSEEDYKEELEIGFDDIIDWEDINIPEIPEIIKIAKW